jgi:hypothetical protein
MVALTKKNLETPPMTYNIRGDEYTALQIESKEAISGEC